MAVKRIATVLLLIIAIAVSATPLAAHACVVCKIQKQLSRDCCATMKCCAEQGKKVTLPLATSMTGPEMSLNLSSERAMIIRSLAAGTFIHRSTANLLANSPPKPALLCTFLI